MSNKMTAISLFSGAGGDTLGLSKTNYTVVAFSEYNKAAIATHIKEFPNCRLLTCPETASNDITKIPDSVFEYYAHKVDVLFAGFPCFTRGTLVLTKKGYKPIEKVSLEDLLLTHTGKFQKIVNIQSKLYTGKLFKIKIRYHPNKIVCTEEHPFYVRERRKTWNETLQIHEYSFGEPCWKRANELTENDWFGMIVNSDRHMAKFQYKAKHNIEGASFIMDKDEHWFTMGYFLGNGWIDNSGQICFSFKNNDKHSVEKIKKVVPIELKYSSNGSQSIYECKDKVWYDILKRLGKTNTSSIIPEWVHSAATHLIQHFLSGFLVGLRCYQNIVENTVVLDTELAYGFQRLCLKLGHFVRLQAAGNGKYEAHCNFTDTETDVSFIDGDYAWYAPNKISSEDVIDEPVYNFEVAEDNSYIVYNTIVHNCQGFTDKKGQKEPVYELIRAAKIIRPNFIIGENLPSLLFRKGKDPATSKLRPVIDIIRDLFSEIGYNITYKVLKGIEYGIPQERRRLIIVGTPERLGHPHMHWHHPDTGLATIREILETHLDGAVEFPEDNIPDGLSSHYWIKTAAITATGKPHPSLVKLVGGIRGKSTQERGCEGDNSPVIVGGGLLSFGVRKTPQHGEIIDPDKPCKTISCDYGSTPYLFVGLHNPDEGKYWVRCLSIKELSQIQGFPAEYKWQGSYKEIITQIGYAVPPPICEAVIKSLSSITYGGQAQLVVCKEE